MQVIPLGILTPTPLVEVNVSEINSTFSSYVFLVILSHFMEMPLLRLHKICSHVGFTDQH
jgi:hypothetical protein